MTECVSCAKFKGCDLSSPNVNDCADYKEQMTNEEWIKSCNTEQLAEFLVYVSLGGYCGRSYGDDPLGDVSHWLSEPHKEAHQ